MTAFDNFFTSAARKAEDPNEKDTIYRLRRMAIDRVDLVTAGANRRTFLIRKDEGDTMKTADMIPGTEGIKNSAGVIVTKAEATAGADEDLQKLIEKMEKDDSGSPEGLVASLKTISKVLTAVAKAKKAEDEEEGGGAPAPAPAKPAEPAPAEESEEAKAAKIAKAAPAAAPKDPFEVIDAELEVIQKAGTRISKGNMDLLTKAMEILQKLSGNLSPEEKKVVAEKATAIAKSLEQPATQHIQDGISKPTEAPVQAPEDGGWSSFEDINK